MPRLTRAIILNILWSAAVLAQTVDTPAPGASDGYLVRYVANLSAGDSFVNLTNLGSVNGFEPRGNICANVYVFAQDQQLIACCSCPLTPNHLKTLSARGDLINNTLTPGVPTAITVALVATSQPTTGATCNAAIVYTSPLVSGLRAWGTSLHATPGGTYAVGETEFSQATLSQSEFYKMTSYCGFIQALGSGYGICNSCRTGAAGADKQ